MKHTLKSVLALAVTLITFGSLAQKSHAAVVIYFEEVGGDVIATTSGSIIVPNTFDLNFPDELIMTDFDTFLYTTVSTDRHRSGTNSVVGPTVNASSASGSSFGFDNDAFYVPASTPPGVSFTPNTQWIWNSTDLASIGLGFLDFNPTVAYTTANGEDTISFAAIPEPSSALLLGFAGLVVVAARRRKTQ